MAELFKVTTQDQTMMLTTGGVWVDGMKIGFETTDGVAGHVTVPLSVYSAQFVKDQINARVKQINEVASL